ncbi:MAG: D-glycerate dehydrogenase [Chloroflexi bacterium HGW-Chloroflexi-4]|jgi:glyoxylate reductase|nr:MAG: D-glycerate dehydrogenase [Chloroflexi bacterium HGW-Chloroflexi-7]PKN98194.1 MAG: D-glycerate dehydrogenase [Chloroflexi bacterium HGW-Chloroflexi-4]
MTKPVVLVTRSFFPELLQQLAETCSLVVWTEENPPPYDWIKGHLPQADALICMLTDKIDPELITLGSANHLKVISQIAVGVDNIAVGSATDHKIPVGHTPGVLTETTADFAWALMMAAARRVVESAVEVSHNIWRPWGPEVLCGADVYGKTLGLIGFGRIGKAMARRAEGFEMKVLYYEPRYKPENASISNAQYVSLDDLLCESDFVSLHAYLSDSSRGMIGKAQLAMMKPSSILINTGRGAMVDHIALYDALKNRTIAAAALDVFDPEPIPENHPLLSLHNVIITPHIASASTATRHQMAVMTIENILAALNGKPLPYCANPEIYK